MDHKEARELFLQMHPGLFDKESIRSMDEHLIYEEMLLPLETFSPEPPVPVSLPGVTFGFYSGDITALQEAVGAVEDHWVRYFDASREAYCAMHNGKVVSFCLLEDKGLQTVHGKSVRVAGPGCVGTIPAFRCKGIGLRLVQNVTQIFKDRGFDISYIHYTASAPWYAKLGYRSIARWNKHGVID